MDVTRHNFKQLMPQIEEAINTASFVTIDGEFTGLNCQGGSSPFDLPEQRYQKLQESARHFLLIQFGLCTFHYNPKTDSYSNEAYNFYVWPRPCSRQAPDTRFLCQTSSLDFLTSQDFDFNKLIKDGVSYLRPMDLDKLRTAVLEKQDIRRQNQFTPDAQAAIAVPPEQVAFLKDITTKLENFIKSDAQTMEIDRCNAFQRRLVYQTAKENFQNLSLSGLNRKNGERVIFVNKDLFKQKEIAEKQDMTEIEDVEEAFGFSKVIQAISQSKKLVAGHNMVLDVCHTLNQFCHPLPNSYSSFKDMTSTIFPNLVDTKLMAGTSPLKEEITNSALNELLRTVSESPYKMPKISVRRKGFGYSSSDDKFHEAGYDAFVTGLCLIAMQRRLTSLRKVKPSGLDADSPEIEPFKNKLYLMKASDTPYMNIGGEDILPDRKHVFHLDIPKEWRTSDIVHLFSPFGGVNVFWINDTSAFVSLRERTFASSVLQDLTSSTSNSQYTIISYDSYMKRMERSSSEDSVPSLPRAPSTSASNTNNGLSLPTTSSLHTASRSIHTVANSTGKTRQRQCRPPETVSGITPTFERSFMDGMNESERQRTRKVSAEKKRAVSPPNQSDSGCAAIKRSKSVLEDKPFDEPDWE